MRVKLLSAVVCVLALASCKASASEYRTQHLTFKRGYYCAADQLRVVDGDTIVCKGKHIRALGFDTPELHIKCEHDRAIAAKARVQELAGYGRGFLIREARQQDKYGRTLARVLVNGRTDLGAILVGQNLAVWYTGGKRAPWSGC